MVHFSQQLRHHLAVIVAPVEAELNSSAHELMLQVGGHAELVELLLATGKCGAMTLEVTSLLAVAALRTEKSRTDDLAVSSRAVLDKVAGEALLVLAGVKADLAEGLPCLSRLVWASSTPTPG